MGAAPSTLGPETPLYRRMRRKGFSIRRRLRPLWRFFRKLRLRKRMRFMCLKGVASGRKSMVGSCTGGISNKISVVDDWDCISEAAVIERQKAGDWCLLPGLPHEVAIQILARVPRVDHCLLRSVCKPWRWTLETKEFLELRKKLDCTEDWLYLHVGTSPRLDERRDGKSSRWRLVGGFSLWHALDPYQYRWHALPPIPYDFNVTGGRVVLGASSVVFDGNLYVVGGAPFGKPAIRDMWVYNPLKNKWKKAASMVTPRFGGLVGVIHNKLYVVGGSGICHLTGYSLPCLEVYDPSTDSWRFAASARGVATNYPCNPLKYAAVVDNKLCVIGPQSLTGRINSGMYDPVTDLWSEITPGLKLGWGKPSTVMDGTLYTVDFGCYQQYIAEKDAWLSVKGQSPETLMEWDPRLVSTMAGCNGKLYMVGTMGPALIVVIAPVKDGRVSQSVRWHTMKLPTGVDFLGDLGHCSCQVIGF
ncbi:hypothetical protein Mapa_004490 [Marchantia paleacea]|nr:hypothetical protein Mapa_004490 [Marchantia paleacea]